ncbi:MAG TPA: hypothetical protein VIN08_11135 [Ohtaekwangia sp.]|uniref:hypothetical protein n=1 Tax=Ohtaekwangia sp. TaxID=2066019 RepID=UPI002F93AB0D
MQRAGIITWILFCLTTLSLSVQAQDKLDKLFSETTPEQRAQLQTDNMQEKLQLSDEQKTKVYAINLKYAQKMEDTYRAGGGKLQRLRSMKVVANEKDGELKNVLNKEQYKLYETYKDEMKENVKEKVKEKRSEN